MKISRRQTIAIPQYQMTASAPKLSCYFTLGHPHLCWTEAALVHAEPSGCDASWHLSITQPATLSNAPPLGNRVR